MEKTHQTAVVLSPSETDWPSIQAIRKKYDRNFRRWMPHITLLYPFVPKDQFEQIVEKFGIACRGIDPFDVALHNVCYFQHGQRGFTLWLDPESDGGVDRLQKTIWDVMPECDDVRIFKNGFTPHLSVGQVKTQKDMDRVLPTVQNTWTPLIFCASSVALIWRNNPPDDVFQVGYSVILGTGVVQRVKM